MIARSTIGYFAVSGLCLLLHNMIMIVADALGFAMITALVVSYCLVVMVGYFLHSLITFSQPLCLAGFGRYALVMSSNLPLAALFIWIWKGPANLPMHWAAPIATLNMLLVNYIISRWAIVRTKNTKWLRS